MDKIAHANKTLIEADRPHLDIKISPSKSTDHLLTNKAPIEADIPTI